MQNSVAKKIFAVGSAVAMTLSLVAPFAAQAAAHAAGTNVKSSDGTIWMIMPDGTRRAYTSAGAFLSYGFNSFASVVDANADDLALPAGSFIPPQDGKIMCSDRGSDKGTCYLVTGAMKAGFTSAAVFTGLGFSFSRVGYGDVSWMTSTSNIDNTTAAHRPGVLVNNNGTVQLVGATGLLGIPDLATFNSWGYSFASVVPANDADKAMTQTGVMAARVAGQLSPTALTGGNNNNNGGNVISGSVSASLAYDTPAANTVAVLASGAKSVVTLAKFSFSGNGTVTQLQVKRTGVSPDTIFSNVYLFNGDTRLTDAASVGGSSLVTFSNPNGLFTINGNMTVSVVAEIPAGTSAGQTVGVQLTSFTVANGSPATVSISGNLMTTAVASDLAYPTFGAVTPDGSSFDPAKDVEVFRSNVTINNRDMTMSRLIMRNIGSAQQADINNFRLRVDGTQIAQTQTMDSNGYVYFSFSPITLKAGTRVFSVLADVVAGSSRNFQYQIRSAADVNFVDTQYNQSVSASNTFPVGPTASNSISNGSLTIQKATDSPSGNVTDQTSDVTLAKYTVTAYGEPMKIETLTVGATSSDASVGSLRNGRVLINGVQYGSTATLAKTTNNTYTTGGTSYTLNYTVQPGTPVTLEIHADMYDNDGTNDLSNNDTVTAYVMTGSNNVQKMVSLGYTSVPSSSVAGNAITDVTGSVSFSKNNTYANQTAPLPQVGYKLASFNLVGSTSEDVNLNSIMIGAPAGQASTTLTALYNVKVMVNGNMFGTQKGSVAITPGTSSTGAIASSTFSSNYTLPKNTTVSVEVYGDINAPSVVYGSDRITLDMAVSGTSVSSSAAVSSSARGQQISVGSASVTAAQDPSTPVAAIVAGNQTKTVAAFKWTTTNDQFTISEVTVSIPNNTTVQNVMLKDGSTVLATQPGQASTTFSNLSIVIPANSTKILTVDLQLGVVGTGAGTAGENVQVILHSYKKAPSSTGAVSTTTHGVGTAGNATYVYKSIPTITNVALPTGVLTAGTNTLAKFQISSGGTGTIGWTKLMFTISTSTNVVVTSPTLWDADTNTQIAGAASTTYAGGNLTYEFNSTSEQQISGAKTYIVKATIGGTLASGAYVSTSIAQPSSFVAPAAATTATASPATFVWSDLSKQSHDLTTLDWNNDYLVKNLPTDAQALTK
ncbi:MAG: hypothetical protein HY918_01710 [Candidatus Doudnabacteria bacterium]|nr:hypothetical protein [Candidatus Doudnabacteria bacterium]